jgi:hypothetical protein
VAFDQGTKRVSPAKQRDKIPERLSYFESWNPGDGSNVRFIRQFSIRYRDVKIYP